MQTPAGNRSGLDRRSLLRAGLLWGGGAAAAGLAAPSAAPAQDWWPPGPRLTLDVACLGDTLSMAQGTGSAPGAGKLYASPFFVHGVIYKGGSLAAGDGFDPRNAAPGIGVWLCHGFLLMGGDIPLPDVDASQEHVLGEVGPDSFGRAALHSSGFEPHSVGVTAPRSVTGGTGPFAGARGVVTETLIGRNVTVLPTGMNAPNLRFEFRLQR